MIASRTLPPQYAAWNSANGAPFGRRWGELRRLIDRAPGRLGMRLSGPYSMRPNSTTRKVEYPWAWHAAELAPGMRVLEIGGGLAGFQFSLSRLGCHVTNVDPGMESLEWACSPQAISQMNMSFGTNVELINVGTQDANLPASSFDRAFSISVIEHLDESMRIATMQKVFDSLRRGGRFVLTVDLFLDLEPFTRRRENSFGTNCNVKDLVEVAPFKMVAGDRAELLGFSEFSASKILENQSDYFVGDYPVLAQCIVLEKPA